MRTLTAEESTRFANGDWTIWPKVEIDTSGAGSFQNASSWQGWDWVRRVQWSESVDDPMPSGQIVLASRIGDMCSSPLVTASLINRPTGSYVPAVFPGRAVRISVAMTAPHFPPADEDWRLVFEGSIDTVTAAAEEVTLDVRGLAATILDRFIEDTAVYSTVGGTAVETVMQEILDASLGASVVTLYTPVSPGWNIEPYAQEKTTTLDALTSLAQQIGWDLRYKWDSGTDAFRFTFYSPDRAKSTPDATLSFALGQYRSLTSVGISRAGVRNVVRVVYSNPDTGARETVLRTNSASITTFGRRYMDVAEDAASNIDSLGEAEDFADAILADLKDPSVDATAECPFLYHIELGDLIRFLPNYDQFDANTDLAVVSISHKIDQSGGATSLQLRGKPCGGYRRWLQMEGRPGVGPSTDTSGYYFADTLVDLGLLANFNESGAEGGSFTIPFDDEVINFSNVWNTAASTVSITVAGNYEIVVQVGAVPHHMASVALALFDDTAMELVAYVQGPGFPPVDDQAVTIELRYVKWIKAGAVLKPAIQGFEGAGPDPAVAILSDPTMTRMTVRRLP